MAPIDVWSLYTKTAVLGEGTYGNVFKASRRDKKGDDLKHVTKKQKVDSVPVALKMFKHNQNYALSNGFPVTAIREIKILQRLKNPFIVKLIDVLGGCEEESDTKHEESDKTNIFMVMEFVDHDLTGLLKHKDTKWTDVHVRSYMQQLLEGFNYTHFNDMMHRDVKSSNILVGNDGRVRIADWGLARYVSKNKEKRYTLPVVTLWYRAPEIFLGDKYYGAAIDMWALGVIFYELLTKQNSLFARKTDELVLQSMFQICGKPSFQSWMSVIDLPKWQNHKDEPYTPPRLKEVLRKSHGDLICNEAIDLLSKLLCMNPENRITAREALDHVYFWGGESGEDTMPVKPEVLASSYDLGFAIGESAHELSAKREHENKKALKKEKIERSELPTQAEEDIKSDDVI